MQYNTLLTSRRKFSCCPYISTERSECIVSRQNIRAGFVLQGASTGRILGSWMKDGVLLSLSDPAANSLFMPGKIIHILWTFILSEIINQSYGGLCFVCEDLQLESRHQYWLKAALHHQKGSALCCVINSQQDCPAGKNQHRTAPKPAPRHNTCWSYWWPVTSIYEIYSFVNKISFKGAVCKLILVYWS